MKEKEYGTLREIGLIDEETPVFANVHELQIIDEVPKEPHDLTVDVVATPTKMLRIRKIMGKDNGESSKGRSDSPRIEKNDQKVSGY